MFPILHRVQNRQHLLAAQYGRELPLTLRAGHVDVVQGPAEYVGEEELECAHVLVDVRVGDSSVREESVQVSADVRRAEPLECLPGCLRKPAA